MASDIVERLQKAADDFEGIRAYSANDINSDCEPHWSDQVDMADASKAVLDAIAHIEAQDLRIAETRAAALEEAAKVADTFTCGLCGMDGKAGAAIRALIPREGEMNERIIGVAAKHPDGNVYSLLAPARHGQILRLIIAAYPDNRDAPHTCIQGFVTDGFRFVDRKEARTIADAAGQSSHRDKKQSDLFSEDLW
jgi:hypothetical protein